METSWPGSFCAEKVPALRATRMPSPQSTPVRPVAASRARMSCWFTVLPPSGDGEVAGMERVVEASVGPGQRVAEHVLILGRGGGVGGHQAAQPRTAQGAGAVVAARLVAGGAEAARLPEARGAGVEGVELDGGTDSGGHELSVGTQQLGTDPAYLAGGRRTALVMGIAGVQGEQPELLLGDVVEDREADHGSLVVLGGRDVVAIGGAEIGAAERLRSDPGGVHGEPGALLL